MAVSECFVRRSSRRTDSQRDREQGFEFYGFVLGPFRDAIRVREGWSFATIWLMSRLMVTTLQVRIKQCLHTRAHHLGRSLRWWCGRSYGGEDPGVLTSCKGQVFIHLMQGELHETFLHNAMGLPAVRSHRRRDTASARKKVYLGVVKKILADLIEIRFGENRCKIEVSGNTTDDRLLDGLWLQSIGERLI